MSPDSGTPQGGVPICPSIPRRCPSIPQEIKWIRDNLILLFSFISSIIIILLWAHPLTVIQVLDSLFYFNFMVLNESLMLDSRWW